MSERPITRKSDSDYTQLLPGGPPEVGWRQRVGPDSVLGRWAYAMHDHRVLLIEVVPPQDHKVLTSTTQRNTPQVNGLEASPPILGGTWVLVETIQGRVHLDRAAPREGIFREFGQIGVGPR